MNQEPEPASLDQEINQILNKTEQKIKELRELNRPSLDAWDKRDIERRLKALEEGDLIEKEQLEAQLQKAQAQVELMSKWLMNIALALLAISSLLMIALWYKVG